MSTASTLASRAAARFKDSGNAVITPTQWLSYLNEAYNRVNAFTPLWPWLETSEQTLSFTAGSRSANLPSDVIGINWAYDTTHDYPLIDQMGRGDFWNDEFLRSDTGGAVTYRLRGSTMELNPIPTENTTVVAECQLMPTALAADTITVASQTGAAAGNLTITGIAVGDTLLSVVKVLNANPYTVVDLTSEFTITATNTINNSGGTTTASNKVVVTYRTASSSAEPVFPEAFHDILIDGALASAYLDDDNAKQATAYKAAFAEQLTLMHRAIMLSRTQNNQPIRDTFFRG